MAASFVKNMYRRTNVLRVKPIVLRVLLCWKNCVSLFYPKGARTSYSFFFPKLLTTWRKYLMSIVEDNDIYSVNLIKYVETETISPKSIANLKNSINKANLMTQSLW